ncbi:HAMP domain-containing sensor histidine kinase [Streptomyces calidiresistens]|uniref:histidine kinase n=1 Tax=Streptomyces calidiresistens TaxID=1485586 RepID=A0A7W3XVV1_9ACTN|nr:ATP-binding protein [Streptomyces calidiresistens]MBB0229178.1 HAMP domain-containing protein [Streptomyces calidiresistens]
MPLRSRLALLTALTVALAVAACAAGAWFLVRGELIRSLDETLRDNRLGPELLAARGTTLGCREIPGDGTGEDPPTGDGDHPPLPFDDITRIVSTAGESCVLFGYADLPVTEADREVAVGARPETVHTAVGTDGVEYRVYTRQLPGFVNALSVARPMSEVTEPLRSLAVVLSLLAVAGAVGAAGVGTAIARAGLRPVDRLAEAAEHIARTEDLSVRIPVTGDDEVARLSRSFNEMTAALASSRDLQHQLIADAGHELRTPLTSLRTNIELLARSEAGGRQLDPGVRRELLASVTSQLGELTGLIGDLQELSRPERRASRHPGTVGLHDVVGRAVSRARLRAPGTAIEAEAEPWWVRAEASALERAVINLLDNAVKFGADGGAVEVVLRDGELRIRDHGPGIPPDQLPHVFERFWRSPDARGLPGSGLGLSIVARAVRESGGTVELRPAPGGGTEAVLRLPGAPHPPPEEPPPGGPAPGGTAPPG